MFGEFLSLGDVAVFGFERAGDTKGQAGEGDDLGLVASRLPAGGDEDVGVEDDAHGKIVFG